MKPKQEEHAHPKGSKSNTITKTTDINSCTQQQIQGVPGIDDKLAEKIVKYRRLHGRFRSFDEIWRVSGMNRGKFQLLARHFRISMPKPLVIGAKMPQARLSLTDSMIDFVCKGQSVSGSTHNVGKGLEAVASGITRSGQRYRISPKEKEKEKVNSPPKDEPPMRVKITKKFSSTNNTKSKSNVGILLEKGLARTQQKSAPKERDVYKPVDASSRRKSAEASKYRTVIEVPNPEEHSMIDNTPRTPNDKDQDASSPKQPSITLHTTPSGNNINFSCTIDKRFLKHPTSMAFHFEDNQPAGTNSKNRPIQPAGTPLVSASCANNKSLWQIPSHLPDDSHAPECKTIDSQLMSTSTTNSSALSQENLLIFERQNVQSPVEKKASIEAWVLDVNVAKDLEAVHKRKRSPSKNRGSWSTGRKAVSPPPKKLLRRPVLEQSVSTPNSKCLINNNTSSNKKTPSVTFTTYGSSKSKSKGWEATKEKLKKAESDSSSGAGGQAHILQNEQRAASIRKHMRQVEYPNRGKQNTNKLTILSEANTKIGIQSKAPTGTHANDSAKAYLSKQERPQNPLKQAIQTEPEDEVCTIM